MVSSRLKFRLAGGVAIAAVATLASANTQTAWGNPLLRDVPKTAKGFVSIDLAGSDKALTTVLQLVEGATGTKLNEAAGGALGMLSMPKPVQDAFSKSFNRRAVLYYNPVGVGAMTQGLVLVLGLKPGNSFAASLRSAPQHEIDGIHYADFKGGAEAHVEGNALLLTPDPKNLPLAVKPFRGGAHIGTAELSRFSDSIEPTAEVVGWMDADTAMSTSIGSPGSAGYTGPSPSSVLLGSGKSFGFSLGLHPKGVSLAVGPLVVNLSGKAMDLSKFRPLPANYLRTLPGGAYLITCLANPWPLADNMRLVDQAPADVRKALAGIKSAISGDYVFGIYPTRMNNGVAEGVDLLIELRKNAGNDPGGGLKKLISLAKTNFGGIGSGFESFHVDGADHAYRLNKVIAPVVRASLKAGLMSLGGVPDSLTREKNLVFADVGSNVLLATSEPVLRKAVAALKFHRNSLEADPKFGELARDGGKPTQFVLALSLTRTLTTAKKLISSFSTKGGSSPVAGAGVTLEMLSGFLASWPDPLMLRLSIQHNGISGKVFLPVDFNTLGMLAGMGMKPSR